MKLLKQRWVLYLVLMLPMILTLALTIWDALAACGVQK